MEEEHDDLVFIPQVTADIIPKIGQEFQTLEIAHQYYNTYAKEAGFGIRIGNNKTNKDTRQISWKMFVCSKEGKTNESHRQKNDVATAGKRKRGLTRCECQAKMTIKRSKDKDIWVVSYFIEKHNHALTTPSRVHLLRSHRKMSTAQKDLAKHLSEANIPTCQQVRLLEIDAGGPSNIGCLERDIRNHKKNVESELFGHDAETLLQHFEMEKEKNENFYFAYETDNDGVFLRYFWADHESRRSYAYFGDAIVFDTTYNTNKYSMVFAPFVGVNHHRRTTMFRCGLLSDEKTNSFVWLFSKFLECMPTQTAPRVIITDQDAAISKAISEVFPNTMHRFCLWHILKKFSEKLNARLYKDYYHRLLHIIKESESVAEFENQWLELVNSTELEKNEWLSNMYIIRDRWIPAYVRHVFAVGMSSSQRVESNHSFFKHYVNRKNSLVDFITRFNRAIVHQRHEELAANHMDCNEVPRMLTGCLMEQQMSSIYTKTIFLLFQKELQNISCSCRLFDFDGYPCRHMLCWMRVTQVMMLPDKCIVQRWTKKLVDDCSLTKASTNFLIEQLQNLKKSAAKIDDDGDNNRQKKEKSREFSQVVQDPNPVRAKGCGRLLKSSKEMAMSQSSRTCSVCSRSGHDKRKCPDVLSMSQLEEPYNPEFSHGNEITDE